MGAAAGKQFQSEKAKHAQAVLSAIEVFEESNHQEQDSYGGVSTEFFKKKVMLAASDAKRKGKDIEKALAQLTDADLDMLAHYVENRKAEERRQAAANSNTMQVEEIVDPDNIDETTSVLSYGDDEEEAGENDELDSSGEILENIEEVVETRPRANSGFKVFPEGDVDDEENISRNEHGVSHSHSKSKLKLEEATVRPGIADHFAKFWDYDEINSLASHSNANGGAESPLSGAGALSPTSTLIGKKFQPSPRQSFPYKDRGQRIDERNEALMVLQRQKVISLTQNAQLEREVEALQRQLEKMDQLDQTFEAASPSRLMLSNTNRSTGGGGSLNNTGNSSHTVIGSSKNAAGSGGVGGGEMASLGFGGSGKSKYSYIYPIDEEASEQSSRLGQYGHRHDADAKVGGVQQSRRANANHARLRDKASKGGSSPSSSDNDSVNSSSAIPSLLAVGNGGRNRGGAGAGAGADVMMRAQGKSAAPILRVRSNDQSDLSDEFPSAASAALGKVTKAHSSIGAGAAGGGGGGAGAGGVRTKRVRVGAAGGGSHHYEGDSDDSTPQLMIQNSRHGGASQYNPSHPSQRAAGRAFGGAGGGNDPLQAKHADSDSESQSQQQQQQQESGNAAGRARLQGLKNKRIVSVNARQQSSSQLHEESESKSRAHDSENSANDLSPSASKKVGSHAASQARARRLTDDGAKLSSPVRTGGREDPLQQQQQQQSQHPHPHIHGAAVVSPSDLRYQSLLDNVNMQLEAARKEVDSVTAAAAVAGGSKAYARGRNNAGGALKKLNRRRHSMDGLDESNAGSNTNVSNTDTSQDEIDASSPSGKYGIKRNGLRGNLNGQQHSGGAAGGGSVQRSPSGTHAPGGESYVTTDDESVGQGSVGAGAGRGKIRRPRAKLLVQTSSPAAADSSITTTTTTAASTAATAVTEAATDGYQPSVSGNKAGGQDAHASSVSAEVDSSTAVAAAVTASTKVKRRGRVASKDSRIGKEKDKEREGPTAPEAALAGQVYVPGVGSPWDSNLDQWWAEVSLLLRKPILQEEDMLYTVAAAEAGLIYTEEMNEIAKNLNVLRGALSRWILPYDNNTRIDSQCSTPHSVVENMPQEFRGKLTERQVHYLVAGANGVRKLIRVKIADDNDLEQARRALKSTDMFFKALYHRAKEAGITPYQLLQMADNFQP